MTATDAVPIEQVATPPEDAARTAIRTAVRAAAGMGVPGIFSPGLDEAGMTAIWSAMVVTIAKRQGAELSPPTAAKLVASALASVSAYTIGSKILTWAVLLVGSAAPFATWPAAMAFNAALNAVFTYKLGRKCAQRFADPTFSRADVLSIGASLVPVLSWSEISDIKSMIVGD